MSEKYEVEVKVELTAGFWVTLDNRLVKAGATPSPVTLETVDAYLFASPVTIGERTDYSFVRIRDDAESNSETNTSTRGYDITTKSWVFASGTPVRSEAKRKLTARQHGDYYTQVTWPAPPMHEITKTRFEFILNTFGLGIEGPVTIALDQVFFTRGGDSRFFIEAEVITENKDEVPALEEALLRVLSGILNIPVEKIIKSPSYLALAMQGK